MGIELQTIKLLLLARQAKVDFSDVLTIGRQDLLVTAQALRAAFAGFGEHLSELESQRLSGREDRFSDALFRWMGADNVDSLDISNFEGASLIHDLNLPLPTDMANRFSVVFDGGTLEHVFNCPTAMATYMSLPQVGGHLIIAVPANNEMGHGFYQFSPEFFFRTLTEQNGYQVRGLFLVPMFTDSDWLLVKDPAVIGGRVGFNGPRRATYLFVVAQRIANTPIFGSTPQQSDYSADWVSGGSRNTEGHLLGTGWKTRVLEHTPKPLYKFMTDWRALLARPDYKSMTHFQPGQDTLPVLRPVA